MSNQLSPSMFTRAMLTNNNFEFRYSKKSRQQTQRYIACFRAKKILSFKIKYNDDFSIELENLFEGGLDFADALIQLFKN